MWPKLALSSLLLLSVYCLAASAAQVQPLRRFRDASRGALSEPQPVPIYNNQWNDFYIEVELGKPGSPFNLVVDTDSSGIWVPAAGCTDGHEHDCGKLRQFNASSSSTFKPVGHCKFQVDFIYGSGQLGQDEVGLAGVSVKNQNLCVASRLQVESHLGENIDGIIGLSADSSNTLLQSMVAQELIKEPLYSLHMARSGEMTFGTIEKDRYKGDLKYVPITNSSRWQFKVDTLNIGNHAYSKNFDAVITTRSSYIAGPADEISALNDKLGFDPIDATYGGEYFGAQDCDLDKLPDVVLTIGGKKFTLTPHQYVYKTDSILTDIACWSNFKLFGPFDHPYRNSWTFGMPFVQSVYTVFDQGNKRLGFAHPKPEKN